MMWRLWFIVRLIVLLLFIATKTAADDEEVPEIQDMENESFFVKIKHLVPLSSSYPGG